MTVGATKTIFAYRGTHSGWLFKEKGESALAKWFQPVARRYFTIDFEAQVLIYSHAEGHKQVCHCIPFRDILSASLSFEETERREAGRLPSNTRRSSYAPEGSWPFEVVLTNRRLRLAAELEGDALKWTTMLNFATHRGRGMKPPAISAAWKSAAGDESGGESRASSSARSDKASTLSTTPGAVTPNSADSRSSTPQASSQALTAWNEVVSRIEELHNDRLQACDASNASNTRSGTPEDLPRCHELLDPEPRPAVEEEAPARGRSAEDLEASVFSSSPSSQTKRFSLQAADFGFEDEDVVENDDSDAETEDSSPLPTPRATLVVSPPAVVAVEAADDGSDNEMPNKSSAVRSNEASRVMADLLLTQKKAKTPESARIVADLALLQKLMAPRAGVSRGLKKPSSLWRGEKALVPEAPQN